MYEYGLLFKAMGEMEKAKAMLDDSLALFEEMGLKEWAGRAGQALEAL
jgi:hypothetical protein